MTCKTASSLSGVATVPQLPAQPPTTPAAWNSVRSAWSTLLRLVLGANAHVNPNIIPPNYATFNGSALPPFTAVGCAVAQDAATTYGGSKTLKVTINTTNASVAFGSANLSLTPYAMWILSFFARCTTLASADIIVTTAAGTYTTAFSFGATATWDQFYDAINMVADGNAVFGLSLSFPNCVGSVFNFTGFGMQQTASGQNVSPPLGTIGGTPGADLGSAVFSGTLPYANNSGQVTNTLSNAAGADGSYLNTSQIFNRHLNNADQAGLADDPAGVWLRWKGTQQTAILGNPSQGHVVDPNFTSVADFWNNTGSASNGVFTLPAMTANQGWGPSAYNMDGRGNQRQIKVQPGDVVVMQITCVTAATGTVATYWAAIFVNSAGVDLGVHPEVTAGAAGVTTVGTAVLAPANAVGMLIHFLGNSGVSGGNNASVSNPVVRINQETLIDKGSTTQLGDARNGRALFTAGVQYYLSGMGLTNPSSGQINCAAGTLLMGGSGSGNVAYNAASVTGLTNGTTYYCYYLDPGFTGGSKTLNATATKTNLSGNPDVVYLGYITPAGGGGGGGGGGGCVYADAYLDTADGSLVQAKDATQGLLLNAQLDDGTFTQLPILNAPYTVNEPCVQLATADGSLILSDMTPVNCAKGPFPAFDTVSETVTIRAAGKTGAAVVTGASFVGACPVVRISLGGASFGAGQLPNGYFIYTHNVLKP